MTLLRRSVGLRRMFCALAYAIGSAVAAPPATAPVAAPPPVDLGGGELDEIDRAARSHTAQRRVLRCWQEGRLIVERPVHTVPPESLRAVELGGDTAMRLYDLRNSTCLIE